MEAVESPLALLQPPIDSSTFDSQLFLPENIDNAGFDLNALLQDSFPDLAEHSSPSMEDSDSSTPMNATSSPESAIARQEEEFAIMVDELNKMVSGNVASPADPHSPQNSSSLSESDGAYTPQQAKSNKRSKASSGSSRAAKKAKAGAKAAQSRPTQAVGVELSEDDLLRCSSEEYLLIVKRVTDLRPLTPAEEQIVKEQKRRIKNRESAQESRERKKAQMETLQDEIRELQSDKEALAWENERLREQVEQLQSTVRQHDTLRSIWNSWTTMKKKASFAPASPNNAVKAAGMCLLVVLFSFGLLFNQNMGMSGPRITFFDRPSGIESKLLSRSLQQLAAPLPEPKATVADAHAFSVSARQRNILWAEQDAPTNATPSPRLQYDPTSFEAGSSAFPISSVSSVSSPVTKAAIRPRLEFGDSAKAHSPALHSSAEAVSPATPMSFDPEKVNLSDSLASSLRQEREQGRWQNANVTFLVCSEAQAEDSQAPKSDPVLLVLVSGENAQHADPARRACRVIDAAPEDQQMLGAPVPISSAPMLS